MKIEIDYSPYKKEYKWKLWTGPDGIDDYYGVCNSLGECFEQIIKNEALNMLNYTEDTKPKKMNEYEHIEMDLREAFARAQQTEEWKKTQEEIDNSNKIVLNELADLIESQGNESIVPTQKVAQGHSRKDLDAL